MDFQSVDYTIDTLLQRIRTSRLALPDFQREFVWKPNEVVELLDSVAKQWPIGSILLLSGPQPFATKEIESGPSVSPTDLESYILDGQQRITSLYHAIMDVSDFCYYINFEELEQGGDDYIHWERRDRFNKQYPTTESRAANKIALVREVWDSHSFFKWAGCLDDENARLDYVALRDSHIGGLQTKVYKIMAIELQQEISLEALARIFETLNRTGVRLNAFDLMVAALYPSGFKLKEEWESALNNNPIFSFIKPDAIEILKLCSLRIRIHEGKSAAAGVRQGDLLKIDRKLITKYWQPSLELYVKALEYCKANFGILTTELVPSWSLILGVAGWLERPLYNDHQVRLWWRDRIFGQFYAQAANTRIVTDFESLHADTARDDMAEFFFFGVLGETTKKNGLLAKALAGMMIHSGALDPVTGVKFTDADKIVMRAIDYTGWTHRLLPSDTLDATIIVTEKSDRLLGKAADLQSSETAIQALASQGITNSDMSRSHSYFWELFTHGKAEQ
ncbi:DUF262 domain-containing protein [Pseudomonas sp. CGJS7]|uniref:DUF262 domain-containing protein n=1 Tax=Pseudomonas sp. CGJS7 TaxID=3109348 RepID=UPI003008686F